MSLTETSTCTEPIRLLARWDPQQTSQNLRLHWSERNEREQAAKAVGRHTWVTAGAPRFAVPVRVSLTVRRATPMDLWNLPGGVKGLVDGLFHDALTPDDDPDWIAEIGMVRQEIGAQYAGCEECEFLVEPLDLLPPDVRRRNEETAIVAALLCEGVTSKIPGAVMGRVTRELDVSEGRVRAAWKAARG